MKVSNKRLVMFRDENFDVTCLPELVTKQLGGEPLRWFVDVATDTYLSIEAAVCGDPRIDETVDDPVSTGKNIVVNLVPTGIACSFGGFAGDAAPVNALLAAVCDVLITNPNSVNASNFLCLRSNALYTEGWMIDKWLSGRTLLRRPKGNRIGVVVEACDTSTLATVLGIIDTARAVHGVDVVGYALTEGRVGTSCVRSECGAYTGTVAHPERVLMAAERLLDAGANAIAITTDVQGFDKESYALHFAGEHPNPVGAAEALVSHFVVRELGVPAAHAPITNFHGFDRRVDVDARSAGEAASQTGLACVLIGLKQAPQVRAEFGTDLLSPADVSAVLAPATALGGEGIISASRRGIPVVAVTENSTILNVTSTALGLSSILPASSYLEAAGLLLAIREGLAISSVQRPLCPVQSVP